MPDPRQVLDQQALGDKYNGDCDVQAAIAFLEHASDILSDNHRKDEFLRQQGTVGRDQKDHQLRFGPALAFLYDQLNYAHLCSATEGLNAAPAKNPDRAARDAMNVVTDAVLTSMSCTKRPLSDRVERVMLFLEANTQELAVNFEHLNTLRRMKPERPAKNTEQKVNDGHPA